MYACRCAALALAQAAGRRSMLPGQEHVVFVLRLLLLQWSLAYRAPYSESGISLLSPFGVLASVPCVRWLSLGCVFGAGVFFRGGCSAGGLAGTGSALGYDCHDLQCACHQTRCVARAGPSREQHCQISQQNGMCPEKTCGRPRDVW